MTQEYKLLLKELCARVPYVTFVYIDWHETEELEICEGCEDDEEEPNIHTLISCNYYGECDLDDNLCKTIYDIKPYLRPMSSMTEKEKKEFQACHCVYELHPDFQPMMCNLANELNMFDWLNEHHFDYRGLIEKGLALEAPKDIYKIE